MTKIVERMTFVMGNIYDRLNRIWVEPKSNNGKRAKRPRWADCEAFGEDIDVIGYGGFDDKIIGHREGFW
ncbi:hypothetical protein IMY05_008G0149200 [Salix suchowensis]|nr:hypothetical protein IMY05_008G0149200 [Salix suchowensis]